MVAAEPAAPPEGAPNVLLVVLDDVGFAQLGCFGSDIATPTFDRLAAGGLRYANFHTTALCSPTRACLLTGRNHHTVRHGPRSPTWPPASPATTPASRASCGFLPEMLTPARLRRLRGRQVAPHARRRGRTSARRRDRWPLGRGFERCYGFFGGETHQFVPALVHDNHRVEPPRPSTDGYHLTEDLVDRAIEFVDDLRNVDADKPFFLYLATGACHSPHQAPAEWIERYRGHFDDGWDAWREAHARPPDRARGCCPTDTELSPRPDWVPAWDDLSRRRAAASTPATWRLRRASCRTPTTQLGRVLDCLERARASSTTRWSCVLSDNGASSRGRPDRLAQRRPRRGTSLPRTRRGGGRAASTRSAGPRIHNNYPWGWTVAGNTPFRRWKRETHEGGVADPLIVHWPRRHRRAAGEVRRQYVHAIDLAADRARR